jgi:hypothetical protein
VDDISGGEGQVPCGCPPSPLGCWPYARLVLTVVAVLTGEVHPTLQYISHIPHSIAGEQLVAQFCRCVPDESWLFQHGRVPMNLIMSDWLSQVRLLLRYPKLALIPELSA